MKVPTPSSQSERWRFQHLHLRVKDEGSEPSFRDEENTLKHTKSFIFHLVMKVLEPSSFISVWKMKVWTPSSFISRWRWWNLHLSSWDDEGFSTFIQRWKMKVWNLLFEMMEIRQNTINRSSSTRRWRYWHLHLLPRDEGVGTFIFHFEMKAFEPSSFTPR